VVEFLMRAQAAGSGVASDSASLSDELDLGAVGRALARKKLWVIGPSVLVALLSFAAVNVITPRYQSEARILIEGRENVFLRPEADKLAERERSVDPEAVASQVQLVLSRDLARKAIKELKLGERAEFDPLLGGASLLRHVLALSGLAKDPFKMTPEERVLETYYERLTAFQVEKSRVVAVAFSSADPELAANAANTIAQTYLELLQAARAEQTRAAGQWLGGEIEGLRKRVAEAEAKVEEFRAKSNLFLGTNNTSLSSQQLAELNSQLALARTQKADAEAKAKLIRTLLKSGAPIELSDIVNSELIRRLSEQGATLRAQLAEQSSTLLGNHPRIKELKAQISDLETQIRREAEKLARSFENDANVAGARLETLTASLDQLKGQAAASGGQDVQLRALEREAKAQRELLESYLAKYREANARDTLTAPGEARIVSRALASNTPAFPKKVPIVLIATLATLILSTAFITTGELLAGNVYRAAEAREDEAEIPAADPRVEPAVAAPAAEQAGTSSEPPLAEAADGQTAGNEAGAGGPAPPDPRVAARKAIADLVDALRAAIPENQRVAASGGK
jgi:uncharacterized protein involved in exopolysaccharide biosynthesis